MCGDRMKRPWLEEDLSFKIENPCSSIFWRHLSVGIFVTADQVSSAVWNVSDNLHT
ncbi:MAG: hypothetical protein A07HR60_02425 [uncultured archaeon A07HR60]|nr:MAG: hypothetical protein A07HR60_02425 [uncultured archaeon A07HR60]